MVRVLGIAMPARIGMAILPPPIDVDLHGSGRGLCEVGAEPVPAAAPAAHVAAVPATMRHEHLHDGACLEAAPLVGADLDELGPELRAEGNVAAGEAAFGELL